MSRAGARGHAASEDEESLVSDEIKDDINNKLTSYHKKEVLMELTYNIIGWIYRNSDEYVDSNAFNNLMKVLNINMINNLIRPLKKYDDYADSYDILNNFYIELVPDSSS